MCQMAPDPTLAFDALAKVNAVEKTDVILIGVEEDGKAPAVVGVVNATLKGDSLTIVPPNVVKDLSFPAAGTYDLMIAFVGPSVGDKLRLCEVCNDGTQPKLRDVHAASDGHGGVAPITFQIKAS